jgi:hypothetical protein
MIAELQFAAPWNHFDISFALAQLASFCASAGHDKTHWAILHHLIEYPDAHSSFKLTYHKRSALSNALTGFAASDWAMNLSRRFMTGIFKLFSFHRSLISW